MSKPPGNATHYHWATKHVRHRIPGHFLDFSMYPVPYKTYEYFSTVELEKGWPEPDARLFDVISSKPEPEDNRPAVTADRLAGILYYAYGVTKGQTGRGLDFYSRTIPSAGGLYPCHLYVSVSGIEGIETGLYYCDMIHQYLGLIQKGFSAVNDKDTGSLYFFITAEFYNSAWKYRDRAFRYMLLDTGHLLQNLIFSLKLFGCSAPAQKNIPDQKIIEYLNLDTEYEVPLAMVIPDKNSGLIPLKGVPARQLDWQAKTPSHKRLYDTFCDTLDKASGKPDGMADETVAFAPHLPSFRIAERSADLPDPPFSRAVLQRRSKRNYKAGELDQQIFFQLVDVIKDMCFNEPTSRNGSGRLLDIGVTCQDVTGMPDGFYQVDTAAGRMILIQEGGFHKPLAQVCLDQAWISRSKVNVMFFSDIERVDKLFGPKGYRLSSIQAGRAGQNLYLAAAGMGIGCCGIGAFYDDEVQDLFPFIKGRALIYLITCGLIGTN